MPSGIANNTIASQAIAAMLPGNSDFRLSDLYWLRDPFRWYFWSSYWGVFGWQRIWMPDWFYGIFALLAGAGVLGGVRLLWSRALDRGQRHASAALLAQELITFILIVLIPDPRRTTCPTKHVTCLSTA